MTEELGFVECDYPGCYEFGEFPVVVEDLGGSLRYCRSHFPKVVGVTEDTSAAGDGCAIVFALVGAAAMAAATTWTPKTSSAAIAAGRRHTRSDAGGGLAADDERPTTIGDFIKLDAPTRVIAHRGFSSEAPENTLAAIEMAIEIGADMVEIDVTVTSDGEVILLHDETLDRTTTGTGLPTDQTLEAIRLLDAGSWFSQEYEGEPIPTLAEALDTVKDRILINIEIKSEAVEHGVVPKVAALVEEHGMIDQVVVSSFSPEALSRMKTTNPAIVTATLFNKDLHTGGDPLEIVQEVGSRGFNISSKRVTPLAASLVCRVESTTWPVNADWTAMRAVSRSRISPTMMISGSWRTMARSAPAKVIPICDWTWI